MADTPLTVVWFGRSLALGLRGRGYVTMDETSGDSRPIEVGASRCSDSNAHGSYYLISLPYSCEHSPAYFTPGF